MLSQIHSLNALRTFSLAAHYLSFKDAAKALNITPAAVSHQIKSLETQLRLSLFHRETRSIRLTAQGERLAAGCLEHLGQLDHLITELQTPQSDITVSCCHSFAALWLTQRHGEMQQRFPHHALKIFASDSLIDLEREKHIDIALRYGEQSSNHRDIHLITEQMEVYSSPIYQQQLLQNQAIQKGKKERPKLFVTQWAENGLLPNIDWRSYFSEQDFEVVSYQQEYFVMQAVMTGQGYGLLSNVLAANALKQGWLTATDFPTFTGYSYSLRLNPERAESVVIRQFCEWLKAVIKTG